MIAYILIRQPSSIAQLDPRSTSRHVGPNLDDMSDGITLIRRDPALAARLIWLRSIVTILGLCFVYASLSRISLAEFSTVWSIRTFLIGFACWAVLREAFGWRLRLAAGKSRPNYPIDIRADLVSTLHLCCHTSRPT